MNTESNVSNVAVIGDIIVPVPSYYKNNHSERYVAIVGVNRMVSVRVYPRSPGLMDAHYSVVASEISHVDLEYMSAIPVEEFDQAYNSCINLITRDVAMIDNSQDDIQQTVTGS